MLKNHFKIAWRNIIKRKFYSALNIFGLSLGIACALFLYLFISFHLSFDTYHKKASTTYRIVHELFFEETLHYRGASMAMYNSLASGLPQITNAAVMLNKYTFTVTVNNNSASETRFKEDKNIAVVSSTWFKLFDYNWLAGNPDKLQAPNTVVLTQKQAVKYFGNVNPVGKIIVFENKQPVRVVGLISDKPHNTDLKADMYVSLSSLKNIKPDLPEKFYTNWDYLNSSTSLYVSLADEKMKAEVESAIAKMAKTYLGENSKVYNFKLQPLSDVHFNSQYGGVIQKPLLVTLTVIGILILIVASVNYINISIVQHTKRGIEIGTRKVLGATRRQLFIQFITETFLITCIAIVFALILVVLLLPVANQSLFIHEPLSLVSYTRIGLFLIILSIVLVLFSGFYPSFILSRVNVFKALKNETAGWKSGLLRKVLVVAQNSVAQVLVICTLIMVLQVRFLKHTDMGFNRDAVVMVPLPGPPELKKDFLRKKLKEIPEIQSFSFCFKAPSSENDRGGSVRFDDRGWETWVGRSAIGDTAYVKSFGLQVIAGRNFRELKAGHEFLINERMLFKLGLKNPEDAIGKSLVAGELNDAKGVIVGVVKDFNTKSLAEPIEPVLITSFMPMHNTVGIKLKGGSLTDALNNIQKSWEEAYPQEVFDYQFLDDQIDNLYRKEDLQQKISWLATSVAIIISCLGLLGLISLITLQRTKEIGIRKVLGASVTGIIQLLSSDFLKLSLIAILLASPLAWWVMNKWLQNFAYRIDIEWWMFVLSGVAAVLIALFTISFQTVKVAQANPVQSLRTE